MLLTKFQTASDSFVVWNILYNSCKIMWGKCRLGNVMIKHKVYYQITFNAEKKYMVKGRDLNRIIELFRVCLKYASFL